jgi:carboxyl-terminal processing protease
MVTTFDAKAENNLTDLPVAVIIDRTSAGTADVVAAAIMKNQRGEVVGERTLFGMGAELQLIPLDDGSALLLTIARHASPTRKIFMSDGVMPSVEVKRADLAELGGDEGEQRPTLLRQGAQTQEGQPPTVVAPKPTEDLMVKKAIEILTIGAKAKKKAA